MKQVYQKLTTLFVVVGLTMVLSCTEDIGGSLNNNTSNDLLTFCTTENNASTRTDTPPFTRGVRATTSTLNDGFGVSCSVYPSSGTYTEYAHGSYFYKLMAIPNSPTPYFWPTEDYKISFYAYYPHGNATFTVQTPETATGSPTYAYTVPSEILSQLDIMTTERTDLSCATHPTVELSFVHRLSDIRFSCENVGAESIILKSISICGVKYSGTLTASTWTLDNDVNSLSENPFTLSVEKTLSPDQSVDVTETANHFMMLPQTVQSGTQIFDIYATVAGETGHYYYTLTSDFVMEAGKSYIFTLKLSDLLEVQAEVQDWSEETDRTGIPAYQNGIVSSFGIASWEREE